MYQHFNARHVSHLKNRTGKTDDKYYIFSHIHYYFDSSEPFYLTLQ